MWRLAVICTLLFLDCRLYPVSASIHLLRRPAIATASIALLLINFSKSSRTVDESRAWLKRTVITWAIINGLDFIMTYITPFFSGGTLGA